MDRIRLLAAVVILAAVSCSRESAGPVPRQANIGNLTRSNVSLVNVSALSARQQALLERLLQRFPDDNSRETVRRSMLMRLHNGSADTRIVGDPSAQAIVDSIYALSFPRTSRPAKAVR